ncbi:choice-of-anchor R domain-containing protein [Candidatus Poriferisodalis sp.]|uniref:choice-of-anchor R domain-containing protein n=1 Tax=Candidatus Poriferisodalis sp. TaxID=3101277 RepID=UPI003B5936DE
MMSIKRIHSGGSVSGSQPLVGLCGRGLFVSVFGAAVLAVAAAVVVVWSAPADAGEPAEPLWSADVTVTDYSSVSIGAATAGLFSDVGGSGDLQVRWLWSHIPGRDLRLAFEAGVADAADYTLVVGDLFLEFPEDSSGASSFKWTGVDVDWEDGQVVHARIVLTADVGDLRVVTATTAVPDDSETAAGVPAAEVDSGEADPELLVANLGVGVDGSAGIQRTLGAARSGFAQAFTTGTGTGGYVLGAVGVQVSLFVDASSVGDQLAVTVNSAAADGGPADALCTLTDPSTFTTPGVVAFDAPTGEDACARLAAGTTYFVVIEWVSPSGTDAFALIPQTYPTEDSAATDEDPGGAQGWSIADNSYYLAVTAETRTWTAYNETASFKIRVTGTISEQTTDTESETAAENSSPTGAPAITGTVVRLTSRDGILVLSDCI